ncbi:hypothetical protein T07_5855, partial [Trichinella nelsoni]
LALKTMHMQPAVLKSKHCEAQPKTDLATTVKYHSFHLLFLHRHFEVSAMVLFCGAVPFLTLASLHV